MPTEELQINDLESTLYSTSGKFTFSFKKLPKGTVAVLCSICDKDKKGNESLRYPITGKQDNQDENIFHFDFKEFDENQKFDLKIFTIIKTDNGEDYGISCKKTIYYGRLPLVPKKTGKKSMRKVPQYLLICGKKDFESLKIDLNKILQYKVDGDKRKYNYIQNDGIYLVSGATVYLFFYKPEYAKVFAPENTNVIENNTVSFSV